MKQAMKVSPDKRRMIRRFTVHTLRLAKQGGNPTTTAFNIFHSYKVDSTPALAERYAQSLNGSCPKTKELISLAVATFKQAKNHIETGSDYLPFGMGKFSLDFIREMNGAASSANPPDKLRAVENFSDPQSIQLVKDHARKLEDKGFPGLAASCRQAIATFHKLRTEAILEGPMEIRSYQE